MKTCGFEKCINPYLDGELSGAKLRSFEAHLPACPRCREEVEQFRGLLNELHGLQDREVPPLLTERLHAALSNEILKGDGRVKRKRAWPWVLSTASAAVVIGIIGVAALLGGNHTAALHIPSNLAAGTSGIEAPGEQTESDAMPEALPAASMLPIPAPTAAPAALADSVARSTKNDFAAQGGPADNGTPNYGAEQTAGAENPPETGGKMLVYTANITEETRDFDASMDRVNKLLAKYGGYVESSQVNGVPEGYETVQGRSAVIALRIPVENYQSAMSDLKAKDMGNVLNFSENTSDVSLQYVDTKARMDTLTTQRERYMALLDKATDTNSIIALQNEITDLTVQIEQDTAQLRLWQNQVSYSTVSVEFRELVLPKSVEPAKTDVGSRATGAFYTTLNNMKRGLEDLAVWFVGFLPWLAIIIVVAGAAVAITVPTVRRRRKAAHKKVTEDKKQEE